MSFRAERSPVEEWSELGSRDMDGKARGRASWERASQSLEPDIRDVSTPLDMTRSLLEDRRTLWVVAAVILLLFAIANLPWQLDDYDQAKQAFTSFQMIKEGRWFYQQTPHEHVATKPPLVGWISAGLFAMTRSWDVAWRSPSLLCAALIAFLLFRSASRAYGIVAGLIAFAAFGFNFLSPRLATLVQGTRHCCRADARHFNTCHSGSLHCSCRRERRRARGIEAEPREYYGLGLEGRAMATCTGLYYCGICSYLLFRS